MYQCLLRKKNPNMPYTCLPNLSWSKKSQFLANSQTKATPFKRDTMIEMEDCVRA